MLTFLRINSIFQLLTLSLLLIVLKLPYFGIQLPVLLPELEWMLVGERLTNGFELYRDIWTNTGPLSAMFYQLTDWLFGRNQAVYEFVGYGVLFLQAVLLTFTTNRRQIFLEKSFIPGAIYIVAMSSSFDMGKLSPALMGTTFLIYALSGFLKQVDSREGVSDDIFEVGLFVGIATMFHLPMVVFLLWALAASLFFTSANLRQMLLVLLGFILPVFAVSVYFYFTNDFTLFQFNILSAGFRIDTFSWENIFSVLYTFALPILIGTFGFIFLLRASRYSGYHTRSHQTIVLGVLFGLVAYFVSPFKAPLQLIPMMPFVALLITAFFLHFRGVYQPEALFILYTAITVTIAVLGVRPVAGLDFNHLAEIRTATEPNPIYKGKKLLIIGERIDEYRFGKQTTCYLNWKLAKSDLQNLNTYESIVNIFYNFDREKPEIVLDKQGVMPAILKRIPALGKSYKQTAKGVYTRV